MDHKIRFNDVWFDYLPDELPRERWALQGVNLTIRRGEYVAIMGKNGSGKSSLVRLLNGLLLPTIGEVTISDLSTSSESHLWEIRRKIGMVFQNPDNQIVAPTVQDDVVFGLENLGIPRSEMKQRVQTALQAVGLDGFAESGSSHLSGGQKQRLAIAGILAMEPEVIVFDEATSMLDPRGRSELLQVVQRLHNQGTTVIYVTHSSREAFLAERIIVMEQGRIECDLPAQQLHIQAERMEKWGLELPIAVDLRRRLIRRGIPIQSTEDLVDGLWRLLSRG